MKNHVWFKGVDWETVLQKEIPPPWVPELNGAADFQYFDNYPDSGNHAKIPTEKDQQLF